MSAEETLNLIAKQWCTLEDIMKLGHLGRNSALKAKKKIKEKFFHSQSRKHRCRKKQQEQNLQTVFSPFQPKSLREQFSKRHDFIIILVFGTNHEKRSVTKFI